MQITHLGLTYFDTLRLRQRKGWSSTGTGSPYPSDTADHVPGEKTSIKGPSAAPGKGGKGQKTAAGINPRLCGGRG